MLEYCWASVADGGPALGKRVVFARTVWSIGISNLANMILHTMAAQCWSTVYIKLHQMQNDPSLIHFHKQI